jgi:hypothetical protein
MKIICAWCKAVMAENAAGIETHGICPKCIIELAGGEYLGIQFLDQERASILFRYRKGSTIAIYQEDVTLKAIEAAIASQTAPA